MKIMIVGYLFENWIVFLVLSIVIFVLILAYNKKNADNINSSNKSKKLFLSDIDLISSRVGATFIFLILLIIWMYKGLHCHL